MAVAKQGLVRNKGPVLWKFAVESTLRRSENLGNCARIFENADVGPAIYLLTINACGVIFTL